MDMTDSEREFLAAMRALTMDHRGHEVFVGLTPEESLEYLEFSRQDEAGGGSGIQQSDRFAELRQRHEAARQEIVDGSAASHP